MISREYVLLPSYPKILGVIREVDTYDSSFRLITLMARIAKADFPFLRDSDIQIKVYGKPRYERMIGIEFNLPFDTIMPENYHHVHQAELTLN